MYQFLTLDTLRDVVVGGVRLVQDGAHIQVVHLGLEGSCHKKKRINMT